MVETAIPFDFNFFVSQATNGKTYLVRADGTATSKEAACVETAGAGFKDPSTCMDMGVFNASDFNPGDLIKFSAEGGNFTETMIIPSSGTQGNEIVYAGVPGGVELPQIVIANGSANECIEIAGKSHIRVANFELTGGGAARAVFIWDNATDDSVANCYLYNLHVLKNHNGATQGAATAADDGFSINGVGTTVECFNISASNVNDNGSGSDQCFTTHDTSTATVTGYYFQDSNNGIVAVGTSSCTFRNGMMRGMTIGTADNGTGNSTVIIENSIIDCDAGAKMPRGTNGNGVTLSDCDLTISSSTASATIAQNLTVYNNCRFSFGSGTTHQFTTNATGILRFTDCFFDFTGGSIGGYWMDIDAGGAIQLTRCDFFGTPASTGLAVIRISNTVGETMANDSFLRNCIFAVENNDRQVWARFGFESDIEISKCTFFQLVKSDTAIDNDAATGNGDLVITDCGFVRYGAALVDGSSGSMITASNNAAFDCGATSGLGTLVATDDPGLYGPTRWWVGTGSDGGNIGAE